MVELNKIGKDKHIIRPIGKGHSPNDICVHQPIEGTETKLHMINLLSKMGRVLSIDKDAYTFVIEGGATLEVINAAL